MSLQEIPPFFEPGAPPFTRSIVLARTEIGKMYVPDKLLAQEELGPNLIRRERSKVCFSPYPSRNNKQSAQSDSELSSLTDSDSEDDEDNLISKPEGEAGRPGRGGYNLEEALAWSRKEYRQLKVRYFMVLMIVSNSHFLQQKYVKKLVDEQLETDKNFSSQSLACIASVRSLVRVSILSFN
jgi:hypothetical protein